MVVRAGLGGMWGKGLGEGMGGRVSVKHNFVKAALLYSQIAMSDISAMNNVFVCFFWGGSEKQ